MNNEASIEHKGEVITAEYTVIDHTLTVVLPDGSNRTTELRGLDPELAAMPHLKSYAHKNT